MFSAFFPLLALMNSNSFYVLLNQKPLLTSAGNISDFICCQQEKTAITSVLASLYWFFWSNVAFNLFYLSATSDFRARPERALSSQSADSSLKATSWTLATTQMGAMVLWTKLSTTFLTCAVVLLRPENKLWCVKAESQTFSTIFNLNGFPLWL